MASELLSALFRRQQRLAADAETFESTPEESTADAAHADAHLSFDAPSLREWLQQRGTPEEDRLVELLIEGLQKRGPQPSHAPLLKETKGECEAELEETRLCLENEANRLQSLTESLSAREAGLEAREKASKEFDASVVDRERRLEAIRCQKYNSLVPHDGELYPPPPWLPHFLGTSNVAVVGSSGVGKSLLINRLRKLEPGADGWAPVGVSETTLVPTMYAFPGGERVRLWDLPGAGTTAFPRETYIRTMGLCYFDAVLVCSACRFTETEVMLSKELEEHSVPYFMVRTKADIDVWNNAEDNRLDEQATLAHIRKDLESRGAPNSYLVSSREPRKYDMTRLLYDVFPSAKSLSESWEGDAWALPDAHSALVSSVQGRWTNSKTTYLINGLNVHVTRNDGSCAVAEIVESDGFLCWAKHWRVGESEVAAAWRTGKLYWRSVQNKPNIVWRWQD